MISRRIRTRGQAILTCIFVGLSVVICAGLVTAAVLAPAPPAVVPLIVGTCIGCPMLAALELPGLVAAWRARRKSGGASRARLMADMRRYLRQLPETQHPLDQ
jgi:hypothetical protein